jgi:hypothetical protein
MHILYGTDHRLFSICSIETTSHSHKVVASPQVSVATESRSTEVDGAKKIAAGTTFCFRRPKVDKSSLRRMIHRFVAEYERISNDFSAEVDVEVIDDSVCVKMPVEIKDTMRKTLIGAWKKMRDEY